MRRSCMVRDWSCMVGRLAGVPLRVVSGRVQRTVAPDCVSPWAGGGYPALGGARLNCSSGPEPLLWAPVCLQQLPVPPGIRNGLWATCTFDLCPPPSILMQASWGRPTENRKAEQDRL